MRHEKQIIQVLEAVQLGCETSLEVSSVTGLPVKHCSAWLRELVECDQVKVTGRVRHHRAGAWTITYKPC